MKSLRFTLLALLACAGPALATAEPPPLAPVTTVAGAPPVIARTPATPALMTHVTLADVNMLRMPSLNLESVAQVRATPADSAVSVRTVMPIESTVRVRAGPARFHDTSPGLNTRADTIAKARLQDSRVATTHTTAAATTINAPARC